MLEKMFRYFLCDQLTNKPLRRKGPGHGVRSKILGYVFLGASNPSVSKSCRTFESLLKIAGGDIYGMPAVYWAPNTFYRSDHKVKDNLRWLNAMYVDIDDMGLSLLDVLDRVAAAGLPEPTMINQTPHGWHVYWAIEPVRAWPRDVELYESLIRSMVMGLGADPNTITSEKFMRIPRNVKHFIENRYTLDDFVDWRVINELEGPAQRERAKVYYMGTCMAHPAMQVLLKGVDQGNRDNSCFTLALAFYKDGYNYDHALGELKEWNKKNNPPLPYHKIPAKVRSAFSGKYHGPSNKYVHALTGINFWYRPIISAKPREDRQRDHIAEIQGDILNYIDDHGGQVAITQTALAKELGAALRTLKLALKALRGASKVIAFIKGLGGARDALYVLAQSVASFIRELISQNNFWSYLNVSNLHWLHKMMVHTDIHLLGAVVGGSSSLSEVFLE